MRYKPRVCREVLPQLEPGRKAYRDIRRDQDVYEIERGWLVQDMIRMSSAMHFAVKECATMKRRDPLGFMAAAAQGRVARCTLDVQMVQCDLSALEQRWLQRWRVFIEGAPRHKI